MAGCKQLACGALPIAVTILPRFVLDVSEPYFTLKLGDTSIELWLFYGNTGCPRTTILAMAKNMLFYTIELYDFNKWITEDRGDLTTSIKMTYLVKTREIQIIEFVKRSIYRLGPQE